MKNIENRLKMKGPKLFNMTDFLQLPKSVGTEILLKF